MAFSWFPYQNFRIAKRMVKHTQRLFRIGQDMIESLIEFYEQEQKPLPTPQFFTDAALEIA
jgi:hypothetical protein